MNLSYTIDNHDGIAKTVKFTNEPSNHFHHSLHEDGVSMNIYTYSDGTMLMDRVYGDSHRFYCDKPISIQDEYLVIEN